MPFRFTLKRVNASTLNVIKCVTKNGTTAIIIYKGSIQINCNSNIDHSNSVNNLETEAQRLVHLGIYQAGNELNPTNESLEAVSELNTTNEAVGPGQRKKIIL